MYTSCIILSFVHVNRRIQTESHRTVLNEMHGAAAGLFLQLYDMYELLWPSESQSMYRHYSYSKANEISRASIRIQITA